MKSNINNQMPAFCASLYQTMQEQLDAIESINQSQLDKARQSIDVMIGVIGELHRLTASHLFPTTGEEIHFFRNIKPLFYSRLVCNQTIFRIELQCPPAGRRAFCKYIESELRRLETFYSTHRLLYDYYRSGATDRDEEYFLRGRIPLPSFCDPSFFNADITWCTSQDYVMSCILANEEVSRYLQRLLDPKEEATEKSGHTAPAITWTASKAALIEILYALQSSGVFNHGLADLKQLAAWFEQHFNISLGNYYHVFQELRIRKKNRTGFLDQLKERLIKRMDEADERT